MTTQIAEKLPAVDDPKSLTGVIGNTLTPHLDSRGAAQYMGISTRLLQVYRSQGLFMGFRFGRKVVFRVSDLDQEMEKLREGGAS